jgi:hypothetical protein
MPMTLEQILACEVKYQEYVPAGWRLAAVEQMLSTGVEDKAHIGCAICGDVEPMLSMKRLTYRPTMDVPLTHVSILVCRQGVACRRRHSERAVKLASLAA